MLTGMKGMRVPTKMAILDDLNIMVAPESSPSVARVRLRTRVSHYTHAAAVARRPPVPVIEKDERILLEVACHATAWTWRERAVRPLGRSDVSALHDMASADVGEGTATLLQFSAAVHDVFIVKQQNRGVPRNKAMSSMHLAHALTKTEHGFGCNSAHSRAHASAAKKATRTMRRKTTIVCANLAKSLDLRARKGYFKETERRLL